MDQNPLPLNVQLDKQQRVRIFISSPGDVADERALAIQAIERLQHDPLLPGEIRLEPVAWDRSGGGAPMITWLSPQEAINRGLPRPSQCAIVVCILWSRIGTPLPRDSMLNDTEQSLTGTEWEFWDAMNAPPETRPMVLTYRCKREIKFAPDSPDYADKLTQLQGVNAFFAAFKDEQGSHRFSVETYNEPSEFKEKLERDLRSLLKDLVKTDAATARPVQTRKRTAINPYPGLRAFRKDQAEFFFGRDSYTDQLIRKLKDAGRRFVAVLGDSGTGKSSLIWAGLLPRLEQGAIQGAQDWRIVSLRPADADDPFQSLAFAASHLLDPSPWRPREMAARLTDEPAALAELVADILAGRPERAELLLFIDQFEELFTLVEKSAQEPFLQLLERAAGLARVRIIITMRAEFAPQCARCPALAIRLSDDGTLWLSPPGPLPLSEMIRRPAEQVGVSFEEGLAERIIEETAGQPGGLAIMAFALAELYQQRRDETRISGADYEKKLGGVKGVIVRRAAEATQGLDVSALPWLFAELVQINEDGIVTRRRVPKARLAASEALQPLVDHLTDARLLVTSGEENPVIEVAHERLFEAWEPLANWIEERRDDLRLRHLVESAAREWERSDRNPYQLWPHERLAPVYEMIERLGLERQLDAVVRDFIRPEAERLWAELDRPGTDHYRRADIGDRLDRIGDRRPGVGLGEDNLPDIAWCDIPGGEITLEGGAGTFPVEPFQIAKYPVTYTQYRAFVEAKNGYRNQRWWKKRQYDKNLGQQYRRFGNCPADNVSWYDAMAFCRWLSAQFGYEVRLPTEWEWQQAATGGNPVNTYPWGGEWRADYTNTSESGLGRTTAVGMYPHGATGQVLMDMAGNLWEWCLNKYNDPADILSLGGDVPRVVRGGSWRYDLGYARAVFRYRSGPVSRSTNLGFRVCRSSPI